MANNFPFYDKVFRKRKTLDSEISFDTDTPGSSKMARGAAVVVVRKRRRFTPLRFRGGKFSKSFAGRMARRTFSQPFRTGGRYPGVGEIKNIDVTNVAGTTLFNTTGTVQLLNPITQGSTANNREGRKVIMNSIHLKGHVTALSDAAANETYCRTLIVYDRQTNAAALTIALVLAATVNAYQFNNLDNKDRFVTLFDSAKLLGRKINTTTQAYAMGAANFQHNFHKRINLPINYNTGTDNSVGSITSGSIYLITIGDAAVDGTEPAMYWNSRIRFTEG